MLIYRLHLKQLQSDYSGDFQRHFHMRVVSAGIKDSSSFIALMFLNRREIISGYEIK